MASSTYCYQCPILLSTQFSTEYSQASATEDKKEERAAFEYLISIDGHRRGFKLMTPCYIGAEHSFDIKVPKLDGSGLKISKKRSVRLIYSKNMKTPTNEFNILKKMNHNLWDLIYAKTMNYAKNTNMEFAPNDKGSKLEEITSYSKMQKNYLLLPTNIPKSKKSGKQSEQRELDLDVVKILYTGFKPFDMSKKSSKGHIHYSKTLGKLFIVNNSTTIMNMSISLAEFLTNLLHLVIGEKPNGDNPQHKTITAQINSEFGL